MMRRKIVLLGDSIFDNKAYIGNEPDVASHLVSLVSNSDIVELCAVDGSLLEDIPRQVEALVDATHLVISAGGNNAILNADMLQMKASNSAEVLTELSDRASQFENHYRAMLSAVMSKQLPVAVSTIYFPNFAEPSIQLIATAALTVFNDVILRMAVTSGLPVLDLRLVCCEASDYANEIEPSGKGGRKIAAAIASLLSEHDFASKRTIIYF